MLYLWLVALTLTGYGQGPWLPEKGGYFAQFAYTLIPEYSSLFNHANDDIHTARKASDQTLQLYGEYGISKKFALIASVPFKILQSGELNPAYTGDPENIPPASTVNAFGNTQLAIKYKLMQKKWVAAVQMKIELPTNAAVGDESGLYPGYNAFAFAPLASIGRGWNRTYFYYYLSYLGRTSGYDDKLDTGVEGGWNMASKFYLIGYFSLLKSFTNGSKFPWSREKQYGLYSPLQEYTAFGLKLLYEVALKNGQKAGFILHASGSTWGFMVAKAPLLSFSVYLKK